MERIVLRHLKGSKASQIEEFPLDQQKELVLGRDPSATVRFDPDRDDLVGRQHARIAQDPNDRYRFSVMDLNSRNGTYLNKLRVVGTMPLNPGDVVQLGAGGPEIQFDIDPLPPHLMKTTRLASTPDVAVGATAGLAQTRVAQPTGAAFAGAAPGTAGAPASGIVMGAQKPTGAIGKATVERLLTNTKTETRRNMLIGVAALLVVVAGASVWQVNRSRAETTHTQQVLAGQIGQQANTLNQKAESLSKVADSAAKRSAAWTPGEIASTYGPAVVQVEFGWKMTDANNGQQVYHKYIPNKYRPPQRQGRGQQAQAGAQAQPGGQGGAGGQQGQERPIMDNGRQFIPAYVQVNDNVLEPALTTEPNTGGPAIGVSSGGSGFVVTSDGFILTNRHVAANWKTVYRFDEDKDIGVLVDQEGKPLMKQDGTPALVRPPKTWVPDETKQTGGKWVQGAAQGAPFVARQEYLYATFPRNTLRVEAQIARISDRHDVALIKVNTPQPLKKVELFDNYSAIKTGDAITVMGYPSIASYEVAVVLSRDMFNKEAQQHPVPDPTLSAGYIGKVVRGMDSPIEGKDFYFSTNGDTYQLTVNSTGGGNSGGPMFDDHGRVTGIFFASRHGDAQISFSVPIKYGLELMTVSPNVK